MEELTRKLDGNLKTLFLNKKWDDAISVVNELCNILGAEVKDDPFLISDNTKINANPARFEKAEGFIDRPASYEIQTVNGNIEIKLFWTSKVLKSNLSWIVGISPNFEDGKTYESEKYKVGIDIVIPKDCDSVIILVSNNLKVRSLELKEKEILIKEIHHRVKNNLQTVSALLRLQSRRIEDPAAAAALDEAVRRIASIAVVHETLSNSTQTTVAFDEVLSSLVTHALELSPRMGEQLDVAHRLHGSAYVSAPVFGRPEFAARGELDIVAAGAPDATPFAGAAPFAGATPTAGVVPGAPGCPTSCGYQRHTPNAKTPSTSSVRCAPSFSQIAAARSISPSSSVISNSA